MPLTISVHLSYAVPQPCDVLLQIEAAQTRCQRLIQANLTIPTAPDFRTVPGDEGIGTRIWAHAETALKCRYDATVEISRPGVDLTALPQTPLCDIPGADVKYLMASRYCHPDDFLETIGREFGNLTGGPLISAARDWIEWNFSYVPGASNAWTTAYNTLYQRAGVCRDYAHVLIAIARAAAIPARMVSVYSPDVNPQDFHAVAEVYLNGAWHLVDATGMASPQTMARIGVGRDAADISFMTAYGFLDLLEQSVEVRQIDS